VSKEIKNLPHSVHTRLARIANENDQTFEQMFYFYALERFLYRLSRTKHAQRFVLKGALMFFGWGLPLRRLTKDIDLQGYTANDVENLTQMFAFSRLNLMMAWSLIRKALTAKQLLKKRIMKVYG
jgi:hypothetical protein